MDALSKNPPIHSVFKAPEPAEQCRSCIDGITLVVYKTFQCFCHFLDDLDRKVQNGGQIPNCDPAKIRRIFDASYPKRWG